MFRQAEVQKAIFDKLTTGLTVSVYDVVPQDPTFPYVVIGEDTALAWDTDDSTGTDSTLTIHTWSRYQGRKETKDIMQDIYEQLNRVSLTLTAGEVIMIDYEFAETFLDSDGESRHGVMRFRILTEG
jgi:hypothetical protein